MLIFAFWTKYTATLQDSVLKEVRCEGCSTEYVYLMTREGIGSGVSMYLLNEQGASDNATSGARESLASALENDFDPVPCPVCGHYQRYMFPKLMDGKWAGLQAILLLVIMAGCLTTALTLYSSVAYLLSPNDDGFRKMVTAWSVLLVFTAVGIGLSLVRRRRIRHFDLNSEDQQARLAIAQSRAVTRAEFEQARQRHESGSEWDNGSGYNIK
jgi:hypothetical protein